MPVTKTIAIPVLNISVDFLIGKNASDNVEAIQSAEPHHLWFHVEGQSSCHVVACIPDDIDRKHIRYLVKQGAILCKQNTSRVSKQKNVTITYAKISDVQTTDVVGSVLVANSKTVVI